MTVKVRKQKMHTNNINIRNIQIHVHGKHTLKHTYMYIQMYTKVCTTSAATRNIATMSNIK